MPSLHASAPAIWIATIQILLTIGLGSALGLGFGWSSYEGVFFGSAIAVSSTMVMLRILEQRGELTSGHGHVMTAVSIVQDLGVIVMLAVLPVLARIEVAELSALAASLATAAGYLIVAILLASPALPWILARVAATGSRELFVITVVATSFGAAWATDLLGFSLALGAFIAGLIISESEYTHQVLADLIPLRDIFAGVFFVSIGALLQPAFVVQFGAQVALSTAAVVIGKLLIIFALLMAFRLHHKIAVLSGIGFAQIGEFSFVMGAVSLAQGLIPERVNSMIIATATVSILLAPILMSASPKIYRAILSIPWLARLERGEVVPETERLPPLREHVIVIGFGTVGGLVGAGLHAHNVPYLVVDYDDRVIRRARARGIPAIYGDGSNPTVLRRAGISRASMAVVALPESIDARLAVRTISQARPDMPVLARAPSELDVFVLYAEGADEVVYPKFEAGLEFLRHTLSEFEVPATM